jgi:hypothetical protein
VAPYKRLWALGAFFGLGLLLAACGVTATPPAGIVVQAVATATVPPISLPAYGADLSATPTTNLPTLTPTDSEVRTRVAPPGTPSPSPTRTRRAVSSQAGATPTLPPSPIQAPDTSAYGVAATFFLEVSKPDYRPGEHIWFDFTLTNLTAAALAYGEVGVVPGNSTFHTSLSGSSLSANERLAWRDWVSFSTPGDQTLVLAMCFSPKDECRTGGIWVNLSAPLVVHVK